MMEVVDHNRALPAGRGGAGDAEEEGEDETSEGEEEEGEDAGDLHTQTLSEQPTKRKRKKSKKKLERERTLPIIVQWLQDTYEEKEGKTVGRFQVYDDYIEFCTRAGHLPTNNAALGKIFKRVFPNVGWRRLGKRGESKMHYANIRKRKVKVEQAVQQTSSLSSSFSSSSSSSLTLTSGSGGIKAEPDEREHGYESKGRAVSRIKEHNEDFGDDDDDSDDDNEYSDSSGSSNGDRENGRGAIMELERELKLGGVEGGDAFIELWGESSEAARHDRFGGGDGSMFGGAVPMAQHRTKFPGRERERRWRRRDHLTTSREQMEEPRGLFFSSGVPSPSSSSSIQDSAMMAAPSGNLAIWNADAHLDLMMAVRYYRDRFRKISWSLIPINPMSLKMRLLNYLFSTEEGQLERSSLSLSACVMISIASFGVGHFDVAEEFFHKAREHLSYVFDSSDYDVASALVPLSWLTTFFSHTPEEGRNRQIYFCTIGAKICEQVGALNDETHWALLSTLHVKSMESASDAIAKTRTYPPYQKQWKKTRLQRVSRGRISGTYDQTGDIFGSVFALSVPLIQGVSLPPTEERRIKHGLMVQLGRLREAEQGLVHAQDQQVRDMMAAYYFAMRTFINVLLENSRQIETARELVRTLMLADRPIMAVVLHELSSNKLLLIRTAIQVLVRYKEYKAIKLLMEAIYPFTSRFPWMHAIYVLTQQAVQESLHGLRIASCSPPLPLPAQVQVQTQTQSLSSADPSLSALVSASAVPPPPAFYLSSDSSPPHSAPHYQHPHSHPHQPHPPHYQPGPPHPHPHPHAYGNTPEPMQRASPSPQLPDRRPSSASYSYIFYADPSSSLSSSTASATDPANFPHSSSSSVATSPTVAMASFQSAAGSASYPTISPELSPFPASSSSRAMATFRPITSDQPGTTYPSGSMSLARALDDMSLLESLLSSSPSPSSPPGSLSLSATSSTSTSTLASYEPPPLAQPWEQELHHYQPQGPPHAHTHAHAGRGGQHAGPERDQAGPRHGSV